MPVQKILLGATLTTILLLVAGLLLQSPYQLWVAMAVLGAITGLSFKTGQRHIITGFGLGIALTLLREIFMFDARLVSVTAPVYAAGYLFAVATTISLRAIMVKLMKAKTQLA